jgi:zinc and cadmium transporter
VRLLSNSANLQALLSVGIVTLLPLLGAAGLGLSQRALDQVKITLTGFAAGALLGDSFIHLLPETYARFRSQLNAGLLCCAGLLLFFLLDRMIRLKGAARHDQGQDMPLVTIALTGTALHNFMDGLLIGGSYLISPAIGLSTTLAVVLHEIPHELGDVGVLLQGGLPIRRAVKVNFLCGLSAPVGTAVALLAASFVKAVGVYLLPIAAGSFLYLAGSVLLPVLSQKSDVKNTAAQFLFMALGIGIMALLAFAE